MQGPTHLPLKINIAVYSPVLPRALATTSSDRWLVPITNIFISEGFRRYAASRATSICTVVCCSNHFSSVSSIRPWYSARRNGKSEKAVLLFPVFVRVDRLRIIEDHHSFVDRCALHYFGMSAARFLIVECTVLFGGTSLLIIGCHHGFRAGSILHNVTLDRELLANFKRVASGSLRRSVRICRRKNAVKWGKPEPLPNAFSCQEAGKWPWFWNISGKMRILHPNPAWG